MRRGDEQVQRAVAVGRARHALQAGDLPALLEVVGGGGDAPLSGTVRFGNHDPAVGRDERDRGVVGRPHRVPGAGEARRQRGEGTGGDVEGTDPAAGRLADQQAGRVVGPDRFEQPAVDAAAQHPVVLAVADRAEVQRAVGGDPADPLAVRRDVRVVQCVERQGAAQLRLALPGGPRHQRRRSTAGSEIEQRSGVRRRHLLGRTVERAGGRIDRRGGRRAAGRAGAGAGRLRDPGRGGQQVRCRRGTPANHHQHGRNRCGDPPPAQPPGRAHGAVLQVDRGDRVGQTGHGFAQFLIRGRTHCRFLS